MAVRGERLLQVGDRLLVERVAPLRCAELEPRPPVVLAGPDPLHDQTLW
jgi:hypothetical protein